MQYTTIANTRSLLLEIMFANRTEKWLLIAEMYYSINHVDDYVEN